MSSHWSSVITPKWSGAWHTRFNHFNLWYLQVLHNVWGQWKCVKLAYVLHRPWAKCLNNYDLAQNIFLYYRNLCLTSQYVCSSLTLLSSVLKELNIELASFKHASTTYFFSSSSLGNALLIACCVTYYSTIGFNGLCYLYSILTCSGLGKGDRAITLCMRIYLSGGKYFMYACTLPPGCALIKT